MKIAIVFGTRPEIIKMSPILKIFKKKHIEHFVLHTGQHYNYLMDKIFFKELNLEPEMVNLNVGSGTHAETMGRVFVGIEKILSKEFPDLVLVQGDTNTVLSGSLVSVKLHIKLAHVEAGLRSYDRRMPEEYNRIITDHISDFLFAPTKRSEKNLHDEGVSKNKILYPYGISKPKIFLTGNTAVDTVCQNIEKAEKQSDILSKLGIEKNNYFLATAHREENVDYKDRFLGILKGMKNISDYYDTEIIYPIHPRTLKRVKEFGLTRFVNKIKNLKIIDPIGFYDLLKLESNARMIFTDSGGIQEEACALKVPCVVLRDRTDRPETVDVGAGVLCGHDDKRILNASKIMINKRRNWENPFGDGNAAERITKIIKKYLD